MEKEYIERESVLKCVAEDGYKCEYDLGFWRHNDEFQELIKEIPAADVVEVVRCKDCKNWETEWSPNNAQFGEHFCPFIGINTAPDWFCADGQRREK